MVVMTRPIRVNTLLALNGKVLYLTVTSGDDNDLLYLFISSCDLLFGC